MKFMWESSKKLLNEVIENMVKTVDLTSMNEKQKEEFIDSMRRKQQRRIELLEQMYLKK